MNTLIPVIELFGKKFNIPSYQRGYRWEWQEVTELLGDLWDFQQNPDHGKFYCLQPIVVRENPDKLNEFELIDGQQRLTTLFLILVYLEDRRADEGYNEELFSLNYTTRPQSEEFLRTHKFKEAIDETNIDFYHICHAYQYIVNWFESNKGAKSRLTNLLMDADGKNKRNVKIIWYEIGKHENPIDAFIRLNVGKIPLTDGELIKALLLQSDRYTAETRDTHEKRLFEIASEWDNIEYALQKEEFWYFLNEEENTKPTRIEFIFDLIADQKYKDPKIKEIVKRDARNATFLIINEFLKELIKNGLDDDDTNRINAVKAFWKEVTTYFSYFSEWYNNRKLFHYIGYLINAHGTNPAQEIDLLIGASKKRTKSDFIEFLRKRIYDHVNIKKYRATGTGEAKLVQLEELSYEALDGTNEKGTIQQLLLLHNVMATYKSDKELALFPFNLYKKKKANHKWSLEHIHAQNPPQIENALSRKIWLNDHISSLQNLGGDAYASLIDKMKKMAHQQIVAQDDFSILQNQVNDVFVQQTDIKDKDVHRIGNLCLVDVETNSYLNNSVFDVKREKIKKREVLGHYIPICSRNAFLKAYTLFPQHNAFWNSGDMEAYIKNIKTILNDFLQPDWKN